MRNLIIGISFLILCDLTFQRCASISSPTGGPKDTIPPLLLESDPVNGTTNYQSQEFSLTFSEFVKADKIKQQLIITPRTENKYKTIVKKNTVTLKFEDPFEDSTTYNFNFADAVTDITESNPTINLSLAFSTGKYIDSLSIEGTVIDLFEQEEVKGYLVGLYPYSDSLDFFKDKPVYFTTTNDSGRYELNYIKSGIYKLLVFNDENSNITFDPESEEHGFIQDSIPLDSALIIDKSIATLLQNIKPITFINSRPTGPYVELKYNKTIDEYSIQPDFFHHSLTGESKEVIRLYKSDQVIVGDSLTIYANVSDSLGNLSNDTIKTAFIESNRKPSSFSYSLSGTTNYLTDDYTVLFEFNKPVSSVDTSSLLFVKDSTLTWDISPTFDWNHNRTKLLVNTHLTKQLLMDSLISLEPKDTTESTVEEKARPGKEAKPRPGFRNTNNRQVEFFAETSAFVSVENDSSSVQTLKIPTEESSSFGTVKITVSTDYTSFTVQLLNDQDKVAYSQKNNELITFPKVTPGKYAIRALIDNNDDGKWSAGNLLLNKIPEELYLHPEETSVRENWVLELEISF